jgi:hypothetical protein
MEVFLLIIIILILLILFLIISNNYLNKKKYTAVIVEPREHKALEFVLQNFLENLPSEWKILIMHGNKNINYINNIINKNLIKHKNRLSMINLEIDNLTINDYNNLLVSEKFYNNIPTELFLIFQTDSIICKENKNLINNFLKYDYVGAPWPAKKVGNGGLSLRKKSKMIQKIRNCNYNNEPEDVFFSNDCNNLKKPSVDDAKYFSIEGVINDKSFGTHKPWNMLKHGELEYLKNNCLNLDKLIELNK